MNRSLYVTNLTQDARAVELQELFGEAGQVSAVTVVRDDVTGRQRSVAYVEMQSEDGARAVVARFDQHQLHGAPLTISERITNHRAAKQDRPEAADDAVPLLRDWTCRDRQSPQQSADMLDEGGPLRAND
jgi:RNA recognition motif-containing protein